MPVRKSQESRAKNQEPRIKDIGHRQNFKKSNRFNMNTTTAMTKNMVQGKPKVWPVIHLGTEAQALENARVAANCGCEGVFVISMDGRDGDVLPVARKIKELFPALLVGINLLGSLADAALAQSLASGLDATWTDSPGVGGGGSSELGARLGETLASKPEHLFFASVAFKYQKTESHPGQAAINARALGMIPTTSGEATGMAPSSEKLAGMWAAVKGSALGVASGIGPSNVGELGVWASHILVSTGVSKSFHEFDKELLAALMGALPNSARVEP